jgi:hypothetical protein
MSTPEARADGAPVPRRRRRPRDRRFWERFPACGPRATLTWREGATGRTILGDLVNVGGEGASFIADDSPPSDVPLWLQLEAEDPWGGRIDPVESRLIETVQDPSGRSIARLRFVHACPLDLFDLAVRRSG